MSDASPVLEVKDLVKYFPVRAGFLQRERERVYAVSGVSFAVEGGSTLGLVGESGCGKSTLARMLVRLHEPNSGSITLGGKDFLALEGDALKHARAGIQLIFQDPYASLNPRMSIGRILEEPFKLHGKGTSQERRASVQRLLEQVGMRPDAVDRFPHEFSGGQRQRVGIARAIALEPRVVICDEPVSALDVSIQSQVLNLLRELQRRLGLTYVFISHDLAVVRYIADRVAVMYLGRLVEIADTDALYATPRHPYTQALMQSVSVPDPRKRGRGAPLEGDVPSPRNPPSGCHFHTRCKYAKEICAREVPELLPLRTKPAHRVACHLVHSGELPEVPLKELQT
jgi:peptide/nickel transport system ATP-binding protein/oligopeptide transport system ATP-binding protein